MTPKSLAEADDCRGLPRKVTVGVEGNPLTYQLPGSDKKEFGLVRVNE